MSFQFSVVDPWYLCILFISVVAVYTIKAFRFYFLLIGEGIPVLKYIRVFVATTFVNIVLPFKAGEFFRFCAFGVLLRNCLKGLAVVLLDRFTDTIALLCIFLVLLLSGNYTPEMVFILLALASGFLMLCYLVLPSLLAFWSRYFILSAPSARHLKGLAAIRKIGVSYETIKKQIRGRFFIIYNLSLLSWLAEIGSLFMCRRYLLFNLSSILPDYLSAALTGRSFAPQRNFVLASGIFLVAVYCTAMVATTIINRKGKAA